MENEKVEGNFPEISIKEFLDFLRTAYQVQESVESVLLANGLVEAVDWFKLKENPLVKTKTPEITPKNSESNTSIKNKLTEVLSEGLLDSVLPYLVPNQQNPRQKSLTKLTPEKSNQTIALVRKKSVEVKPSVKLSDSEVEIHVCDELKNQKKDFICNQKLLVEKMGYFAEVTTGQRLEDMDISVHCDISIFEWLMKWVKKDSLLEEDHPQLDPQCVIPILVSAAFLQMEPLQNDCLLFCHEQMNEVLRTSTNLSCLNDSILTRLSAMYTNTEVEAIRDRKDKIQSRIFTKLIQSLAETEPESVRGHWSSLARIYRCAKCQQLVSPAVASDIPCVPPCMLLRCDGSIKSRHVRDPSWNINDYIVALQKSLKSWRKVYWRLWGDAHFLFCTVCDRYFPARQIGWCRHHPDAPQYFTVDAQKAPLPVGRYPCCGERAYRFELIPHYSGCQFREHTIRNDDVRENAIVQLLETFRSLVEEEPPQLLFPERLTRLVARDPSSGDRKLICKETFWWEGFQIVPTRPKLGLLHTFAERRRSNIQFESSDEENVSSSSTSSESSDSSSSDEESAESNPPQKTIVKRKRRIGKKQCRSWQNNLSARSNQDIQRAHEENAFKEMTSLLNRRLSGLSEGVNQKCSKYSRNVTPIGGLWIRLESDWREANAVPNPNPKLKSIFTGKSRTRTAQKFN